MDFFYKIGEIVEAILDTLESALGAVCEQFKSIVEVFVVLGLCGNPFIILLYLAFDEKATLATAGILAFLILILCVAIVALGCIFDEAHRNPIKTKRFTRVNSHGDIEVNEWDLNEAIIKLYELENKEEKGDRLNGYN